MFFRETIKENLALRDACLSLQESVQHLEREAQDLRVALGETGKTVCSRDESYENLRRQYDISLIDLKTQREWNAALDVRLEDVCDENRAMKARIENLKVIISRPLSPA